MSWICKNCETENPDGLIICEVCSSPREDSLIHKYKGDSTAQLNNFREIIDKQNKEIAILKEDSIRLKSHVSSLKNKLQRRMWMCIMLALILGGFVWTKVLSPSIVSQKNMGEYYYYGPIQHGKPQGKGIAIYHSNDTAGRLYYYGNFTDGKRIDDNAIMFYKDGSYFHGSMDEGKWFKGIFFDVEKAHFIGEFEDNKPWNGAWYKHIKEQTIINGKPQ